ncbi:MAG: class I SAM-dependent methyltransferase [Treponemataceae bacterium]|nr:class I SAM-dependent methyltransferase [Spirochaetales bacterium]MDY6031542.1 class I SAM-dependent methyltransferase [Treponemataceae bacterium]
MNNDTSYQSEILCNRLSKRSKHLRKWARRENVTCYRLYDRDIPEIPLAIDLYEGILISKGEKAENIQYMPAECQKFLVFYLYERPYEKDENEEAKWFQTVALDAAKLLGVSSDNVILKMRKKQKGKDQYQKNDDVINEKHILVTEQGQKFIINLNDYLDTGLFFDHRPLRKLVRETCAKKSVLNLYCYTGSFSVYAASGKAKSVTSVDLSNTYIGWAKKNFAANGIALNTIATSSEIRANNNPSSNGDTPLERYRFVTSDVLNFLKTDEGKYDIIILDPPTFSNSKKTTQDLDINRDWSELVKLCCEHLTSAKQVEGNTNSDCKQIVRISNSGVGKNTSITNSDWEQIVRASNSGVGKNTSITNSGGGVLYFSTNSHRLKFDPEQLPAGFTAKDITDFSIPEDYRNKKIHRCWEIRAQIN